MTMSNNDFPNGWEILYSCYLLGGQVLGKVRLQKIISEMQKEGLPINYYFVILGMGPYSTDVETDSRFLHKNGLINISLKPTQIGYNERNDYTLTTEGRKYVEEKILPGLKHNPNYTWFSKIEEKMKEKFDNRIAANLIVNRIHKELILDNSEEFKDTLDKTLQTLEEKYKKVLEINSNYCLVWIALTGVMDLFYEMLQEIKQEEERERGMGKTCSRRCWKIFHSFKS